MNDNAAMLIITLLFGVAFGGFTASILTAASYEREAVKRGHMVQCLGKQGYYWECDEHTGEHDD